MIHNPYWIGGMGGAFAAAAAADITPQHRQRH